MRPVLSAAVALGVVALVGCGSTARPTAYVPSAPPPLAVTTTLPTPPIGATTTSATPPPQAPTTLAPPPTVTILLPTAPAVTVTNATLTDAAGRGVSLHIGAVVDVDLTSDAYTPSGAVVPWPVSLSPPPPGAAAVLVAVESPSSCPPATLCRRFEGATAGRAEIVISGPAGIVCQKDGTHCIGVAAAIFHVQVTVTA